MASSYCSKVPSTIGYIYSVCSDIWLVWIGGNKEYSQNAFYLGALTIYIISKYFLHNFYYLNYCALPGNGRQRTLKNAQLNTTSED